VSGIPELLLLGGRLSTLVDHTREEHSSFPGQQALQRFAVQMGWKKIFYIFLVYFLENFTDFFCLFF
jgi:hypothetical protein